MLSRATNNTKRHPRFRTTFKKTITIPKSINNNIPQHHPKNKTINWLIKLIEDSMIDPTKHKELKNLIEQNTLLKKILNPKSH